MTYYTPCAGELVAAALFLIGTILTCAGCLTMMHYAGKGTFL